MIKTYKNSRAVKGTVITSILFLVMGIWGEVAIAHNVKKPIKKVDYIIAWVNNHVITASKLEHRLRLERAIQPTPELRLASVKHPEAFREKVLQKLIQECLLEGQAKKANIQVTPKELEHAVSTIVRQNRLSKTQFKQQLSQSGVHYDDYLDLLKYQILLNKLQAYLVPRKSLSDQDIRAFKKQYAETIGFKNNRYHLKDFVVLIDVSAPKKQLNQSRKEAQYMGKHIRAGRDKRQLQAEAKARNLNWIARDLGWQTLAQMPEIFAKQVVKMPVKGVSEVFQAPNGFHLLQLLAKDTSAAELSDEQARRYGHQQNYLKEQRRFLKKLRETAYVKIRSSSP